jgi:hypothetical protein
MYRKKCTEADKVELLKPGTTVVRSAPVGATSGFTTRKVNLAQTDLPSIARGQLLSLKSDLKYPLQNTR